MKLKGLAWATLIFALCAMSTYGQGVVVVHDPTKQSGGELIKLGAADQGLYDSAVASAKKTVSTETCEPGTDVAGSVKGSFTKAGAKQTLIFYQYCQTGNGFGWVGLVLIDDGKVIGNYIAEVGWSVGIATVPDINQNGLNEFTLAYSGGMHQGQGGTGVDLMEFSGGLPKGIGWYKAEEFGPTEAVSVWKLTAKPGPSPVYYKQKYFSGEGDNYRRVGTNSTTKLTKAIGKFSAIK